MSKTNKMEQLSKEYLIYDGISYIGTRRVITIKSHMNFVCALFSNHVPVELRKIILDYFGNDNGYFEYGVYQCLLTSYQVKTLCHRILNNDIIIEKDNISLVQGKDTVLKFKKFNRLCDYYSIRVFQFDDADTDFNLSPTSLIHVFKKMTETSIKKW